MTYVMTEQVFKDLKKEAENLKYKACGTRRQEGFGSGMLAVLQVLENSFVPYDIVLIKDTKPGEDAGFSRQGFTGKVPRFDK